MLLLQKFSLTEKRYTEKKIQNIKTYEDTHPNQEWDLFLDDQIHLADQIRSAQLPHEIPRWNALNAVWRCLFLTSHNMHKNIVLS